MKQTTKRVVCVVAKIAEYCKKLKIEFSEMKIKATLQFENE